MPPTKNARSGNARLELIRAITAPLGFYVLSLLVIEATLALVLAASKLVEEHVWQGFIAMIVLFFLGLSDQRVSAILAKYNLKLTRLSDTPSVSGQALVGLIEKVGA